ncbi:virulence protein RhuM/Fic/DOC family protein [Cetobacterium somerae]|uniref:virulence protein RhuM/Fic/DOC family protein n=1 Tax=Cetobacterium somerae TaxID=188913 RepID=UPI00248F3DC2|nr:virulence protein RhuM/Fic/DOC family protein [Cetobacterium somerae]
MKNEIKIYEIEDKNIELEVSLENETVWLTQKQMSELFDRDRTVITRHINNIFKEEELDKKSVSANFALTANDGKVYNTEHYNLDVIISVGYRVKSKRGTQFRMWANKILKDYLIKGYVINEKKLKEQSQKLIELQKTIEILNRTVNTQRIDLDEAKGLLDVISQYSYALKILDDYDHQNLYKGSVTLEESYNLSYEESMRIIELMKDEFSTELFGREKDESFKGSLGAIYQTAFGEEVYPSIEEKAANLLYFIVKNHSFLDGNKRIAAAIFIYFMQKNDILFREDGSKKIADNTLVAIILMIAESKPNERELIISILINLINNEN